MTNSTNTKIKDVLPEWEEGILDIHHINTFRGDAAFCVFPDGTTMLFDAGDFDYSVDYNSSASPLKRPPYSLGLPSPGVKIAQYIKLVYPKFRQKLSIDFAIASHFHADHYGCLTESSRLAKNGNYRLSGITEVDELVPITTLIDRNYPNYDFPVGLENCGVFLPIKRQTFDNYLAFVRHGGTTCKMITEALDPGKNNQIRLVLDKDKYPTFSVQNLACNGEVWTGNNHETKKLLDVEQILDSRGKWDENCLSTAIKINYGAFGYYTGGDLTGLRFIGVPEWYDVASEVGKVTGPVDVMTLNHHGNRDGSNENFERCMSPRVIVQQSWCSDHPGQEVFYRMSSPALYPGPRDLFATYIHEETKTTYGLPFVNGYQSMRGHILVRVQPGGSRYHVIILDDENFPLTVKNVFGPYEARSGKHQSSN